MEGFDKRSENNEVAYLTKDEIKNLVKDAIQENTNSITDKIISELAKKAVGIFITIIVACFATFGALTYFISVTSENLKLKTQIEQMTTKIYQLEHSQQKVK